MKNGVQGYQHPCGRGNVDLSKKEIFFGMGKSDNDKFLLMGDRKPGEAMGRELSQASPATIALHKNFCNAITGLRRDLVRSIYYLRVIYDRKVYRALGYTNIRSYATDVAGLTGNQCRAFLKIGEKLEDLPAMRAALSAGTISWTKASHIATQATRKDERQLVDLAQLVTAEQLRKISVSEKSPAEPAFRSKYINPPPPLPPTPSSPRPRALPAVLPETSYCYVTYKLSPEQYTAWAAWNRGRGKKSKEEFLLENLDAKHQKKSHGAFGPNYLLKIQECPVCGHATHSNNRGTFEVPMPLLQAAHCDSVVEDADTKRRTTIPPRIRRSVFNRDGYRCQAEGCPNTQFLQIHHLQPAAQGGGSTLENLITLCSRCHRKLHENEIALRVANRDPA